MASAPMKAKNVPGVMSPWMTSRPPYQITSPMPIAPMSSITGDDSSDTQDWRKLMLMIRAFSLLKRPVSCFSVAKALMTRMPLSSSCNMLEMLAFTSAFLRPYRRRARLNSDSGNPATGRTMMAQHASSKFCWNTTYSRLIMVITCRMICMNAGRLCRIMPTSLMTRDMSAPTCDSS